MNTMKNTISTAVIFIILSLVYTNQARAGFYDWLASRESSPISIDVLNQSKVAYSDNDIWDLVNESLKKEDQKETGPKYKIVQESIRQVTAYNVGDIYQTDSTPCTGAYSKVNLCEEIEKGVNVCAANFVPLETKLRITIGDESFECVVWDRMHSRFSKRVDIAMSKSDKKEARQFGLQKLKVQILEEESTEIASSI